MGQSNTLLGFDCQTPQMEVLHNTKDQYMKESYTLDGDATLNQVASDVTPHPTP